MVNNCMDINEVLYHTSTILHGETIHEITNPSNRLNRHGLEILERWARNSPDELWLLAYKDTPGLISRLYKQQEEELKILTNPDVVYQHRTGLAEHEIFQIYGLETELDRIMPF